MYTHRYIYIYALARGRTRRRRREVCVRYVMCEAPPALAADLMSFRSMLPHTGQRRGRGGICLLIFGGRRGWRPTRFDILRAASIMIPEGGGGGVAACRCCCCCCTLVVEMEECCWDYGFILGVTGGSRGYICKSGREVVALREFMGYYVSLF